ncbi:MAG: hypothetical protein J6V37_01415 [Clostridia bacterium]|nr:hypothetical protein [Clostridia bacterium]
MDKNEILEMSRNENKNGDEREQNINLKASNIGLVVSMLLAVIYAIVGMIVLENNLLWYSGLSIVHAGGAVRYWIMFAKLKVKSNLWLAICQTALSVGMIALLIMEMVKAC